MPPEEPHPQFGFVIDQRKCIGCHACTVACKSENEVPLGNFRTWVKYTEKGSYPEVRRHFTVLRCNHCDDAPCVEICPVNALHKRPDAIVDLDRDACIGCRGCMQACPYDALYLNEDDGVAEKCHYCAHRTELGLEPACVVVCPERAIIPGDVSDPESEIATTIRDLPTSRRRLEKGTNPRVWYVDALPESLDPIGTSEPSQYLWSERPDPQPQVPPGMEPPDDVWTTLDVAHPPVWGWHIWTYLLTKNLSAGAMIVAPLLVWLGVGETVWAALVPEITGLVFLGVTLFLLIHDLGRPERFLKILLTPNTDSWLVKGGWVLTAFGAVTAGSLAAHFLGEPGWQTILRWVAVPLAVLTSGYSAWLFAQCRARDLWHGSGLFRDLVHRALLLGCGVAMVLPQTSDVNVAQALFGVLALLVLVSMAFEGRELPDTDHAKRAHAIMESDLDSTASRALLAAAAIVALASAFPTDELLYEKLGQAVRVAGMALLLGWALFAWSRTDEADRDPRFRWIIAALLFVGLIANTLLPAPAAAAFAFAIATLGLFVRERAWVRAGQAVPIS